MGRSTLGSQASFENQIAVRSSGSTELKFLPYVLNASFASVSSAGTTLDVGALIAQGTQSDQRVGRSVFVKDLVFDATLEGGQSNLATDDSHNTFRICVYAGGPAALIAALATVGSLSGWQGPENLSSCRRVLHDSVHELVSPGRDSTGYMPALKKFKCVVPVNRRLVYTGTAGSTVSFETIVLWMISDSAVPSHPGVTYGNFCLRFSDE